MCKPSAGTSESIFHSISIVLPMLPLSTEQYLDIVHDTGLLQMLVAGGCGTRHVAGWHWVMARGAAAAHLQPAVSGSPGPATSRCSAAVLQSVPAEDWSPGGCGASHNTPSVTKYPSTKIFFYYKISFSSAFMELASQSIWYLPLLYYPWWHIFVLSILTISIWHDVRLRFYWADHTSRLQLMVLGWWHHWLQHCSTAEPRPAAGSRSLQTQHSLPARDGAQPSPRSLQPPDNVRWCLVTALLYCSTAALQHCRRMNVNIFTQPGEISAHLLPRNLLCVKRCSVRASG